VTQALFTFHSSHAAMAAEICCEEAGFSCRLIPLPSSLSAGCGLALLCPREEREKVASLLACEDIPFESVYAGDRTVWQKEQA
jgi:hypothetical protein